MYVFIYICAVLLRRQKDISVRTHRVKRRGSLRTWCLSTIYDLSAPLTRSSKIHLTSMPVHPPPTPFPHLPSYNNHTYKTPWRKTIICRERCRAQSRLANQMAQFRPFRRCIWMGLPQCVLSGCLRPSKTGSSSCVSFCLLVCAFTGRRPVLLQRFDRAFEGLGYHLSLHA